ncbi:WD40 repeat domain-containing protein [Candidatus Albibeggiatoa sp. nov. NOAA]|uniref:WD40 repeat domain-containing protein n=1 Tax=Candidatus Albibeggiatoa sp. nov. NOAA TaxID=3162724 RepID=UPI0032F613AF|nr:WD40 repeat domain-containing protein [Thiotrichaceae bacterium]
MESWQESYKKHQAAANEIAEKSIAQEVLQTGLHNWEENGNLLTNGELTHIRLWLHEDELSEIEKQFISESQKAILNQAYYPIMHPKENRLLSGLIGINVLALLLVGAIVLYFIISKSYQSSPHQQSNTSSQQVASLNKQIANLEQQRTSLQSNNQLLNQNINQLTAQKYDYYSKWVLSTAELYIKQDQFQTATALLLKAFEQSPQPVLANRLYDIITQHGQQPLQVLSKHQTWIQHATFSPDNQYIVTVSVEGFGYLWEIATGEIKRTFMLPDWSPLSYAKFNKNGELLLIVGGNTALVWDMTQQKQISLLSGHNEAILSASFSNDSQYIVTASQDNTARLWEAHTGELLQTYKGHQDIVYTADFLSNNQLVATGSKDGTAKLWQVKTGQLVQSLDNYQEAVKYICFQSNKLFVASFDGQIQYWDTQTAKQSDNFSLENIRLTSFDCQTDKIAASFENKTILVWKPNNTQPLAQLTSQQPINHVALKNNILMAASDTEISVWDWKTQKELYAFTTPKKANQITVSPNGKSLLVIVEELAYIYPLFHSQSEILQAAELMVDSSTFSTEALKQFEIK